MAIDTLGRDGGKQASDVLRALAAHCIGETVDWMAFWQYQGVVVVPAEVSGDRDVPALLAALPQVVHAALADDPRPGTDPERDWVIVDARNGLVSAPKTLEELGLGALQLTRARVQQIERREMTRAERACEELFHGTTYRLNPSLDPALAQVMAAGPTSGTAVFEDDLWASIGLGQRRNDRLVRRLAFLLRLMKGVRIEGDRDRRPALWRHAQDDDIVRRVAVADRIGHLLTETSSEAMTETDIVVELNRGRLSNLVSLPQVREAMLLCRVAERLDDGRWQGRFELLSHRGDQAYRIVAAAGVPLDLDVIAREINARSRGRLVRVRSLSNQLSHDGRLVPIGKSGEWGLTTDHAADAAPIVAMMVDALRRAGRPLSRGDIQAAVAARRKVAKASVPIYLDLRPEFTRLLDGTWALSDWPESKTAAAPRRVPKPRVRLKPTLADRMEGVVVPYLQATPSHQRALAEVVDYISETLGIVRNTVYAYLNRVPQAERAVENGRNVVRLVGPLSTPEAPDPGALRKLIAAGETPRVEFKSTLGWDIALNQDNPGLQKMVTKTIAALHNTNGGTLLIGVTPAGIVCGIELDCALLQKNDDTCVDAFSRALAAILAQHLGGGTAAQVVTHYQGLDGKTVCVIDVPPGKDPVYLRDAKGSEFYVRSGTTSRALDLPEVAPYIQSHWS
ncbi:MAG: RNA-binding domain-containing protein [Candidatus Limnocylindrales bacterium]